MADLIRDTAFGHLVRILSKNKYLQYQEEKDPELWKKYVDEEKSGRMAHHGTVEAHGDDSDTEERPVYGIGGVRTREDGTTEPINPQTSKPEDSDLEKESPEDSEHSSPTRVDESEPATYNEASGVKIDPEKGRDLNIVDWWGPKDPENPLNWSTGKKFFVTFEICLLTFSVYIGSAIYSAGVMDVSRVFKVSEVAALLGLTLFVGGYAVGPMVWAPMSESKS